MRFNPRCHTFIHDVYLSQRSKQEHSIRLEPATKFDWSQVWTLLAHQPAINTVFEALCLRAAEAVKM